MSAPDLMATDPRTLDAPALIAFARALLAKDDRKSHWTVAAIALGRIADERLWEQREYGAAVSDEAWAKEQLGMTRGEVRLALKLYRAMQRHPTVPWATLRKPKALLLDEVLTAGGSVTEWSLKATGTTTRDFEAQVRRQLKEDIFLTLTIRYPESMAELVEAALSKAAQEVRDTEAWADALVPGADSSPPPAAAEGSWRAPGVAFRALEVLCVTILHP